MGHHDVEVQALDEEGVRTLLEWADKQGWRPGIDDASPYFAADAEGFLGCFVDGQLVSTISAVRYGDTYGFMGLFICHPDFRGQGFGMIVWNAAIRRLEGRTIGLNGVVRQQENYKRSGFKLAHNNVRYSGIASADMPMDSRISIVGKGILPSLIAYDRNYFPEERTAFLEKWLEPMNPLRRGLYAVVDGRVCGYGVIRAAHDSYRIGPLVADTPEIADLLFRGLAGSAKGQMIHLDMPEVNEEALKLAERYDLSPMFTTGRMYKGQDPNLPLNQIYAITTLQLG